MNSIMHSAEIILFMACLIFEEEIVAAAFSATATRVRYVHRADTAGLSGAACLSGSSVSAIAPTVSRHHVREGIVEAFGFGVYAISERQPELLGIHQDAFDGSERDVKHIVDRSASVGVAGHVAGDEPEPLLTADRSWLECPC